MAWGIDMAPYVSSSSGGARKPARRRRCSIGGSQFPATNVPPLAVRFGANQYVLQVFPPEASSDERCPGQNSPPDLTISPTTGCKIQNEPDDRPFTMRA